MGWEGSGTAQPGPCIATKPKLSLMLYPMAVMKGPLTKRHRAIQLLVNIHQAKTHLFQLLQEVEQGQETAAAARGAAGAGATGGGVREPGNVVGDGDQAVDRPAAGGSAGTGAPGAVAGLPLATNQQRPFAGRGGTRDRWYPPGSLRSLAGLPEPGGADKVTSSMGTWGLPEMAWLVQQLKQAL